MSPQAEHYKFLKDLSDQCGLPIEEDGQIIYTPDAHEVLGPSAAQEVYEASLRRKAP